MIRQHRSSAIAQMEYRIRINAVRHMVEEGLDERGLTAPLAAMSKLLEVYPDEFR